MLAMNKVWVLALFLCVSVVPLAETQDNTSRDVGDSGNAFLSLCGNMPDNAPSGFQQGDCLGYIVGVDNGVQTAYDIENQPQPYCVPDAVTHGQMIRVLIKFINDHPEKAHEETRLLEFEALMGAFPCKAKK
jgi:Rap1a immunity proteins